MRRKASPAAAALAATGMALGLAMAAPAAAQTTGTPTPETMCDGRYAAASAMLDAAYGKYGTLYSGGEHWRGRDDVGATLDLYRLWRGLDDLNLRELRFRPSFGGDDDPLSEGYRRRDLHEIAPQALAVIEAPAGRTFSDEELYVAAAWADLVTSLGPSPLWWVGQTANPALTETEERTRALAAREPLVAWLQTVLAASDTPWAYGWYLGEGSNLVSGSRTRLAALEAEYEALASLALDRFGRGEGIEWLAAGAMLDSWPWDERLGGFSVSRAIADCAATPAEFAANAVLRLEQIRHGEWLMDADRRALPAALYDIAFRNSAWNAMFGPGASTMDAEFERLLGLVPGAETLPWLNVARTYRADSVDMLARIHGGAALDSKTLRALNALSVENLLLFANAPGRHPDERGEMLKVAFCRLVALGRFAEAQELVPGLQAAFPDQAGRMRRLAARRWPLDVRMALIALELPDMSVWLTAIPGQDPWTEDVALGQRIRTKTGADLPYEMRTAAFLQRDLEVWLQMPERWGAFRHLRGYSVAMAQRANARDRSPGIIVQPPGFLAASPRDRALPFAGLIAWDEISRLGPRNGLSRQIGLILTAWADDGAGDRLRLAFAPKAEMAAALQAVVRLYRRNDMGEIGGEPLGRRAFELLHRNFPQTEAARSTPYWHACTDRCER